VPAVPAVPAVIEAKAEEPVAPPGTAGAIPVVRPPAVPVAAATEGAPVLEPKAAPPIGKPGLGDQLARIEAARGAVARGDADDAIAKLDRYDLDFPGGALYPESLVLRVEAYALRHDATKVEELGRRYLAAYPDSPLAKRVQKLMSEAAP